MGGNSHDGWLKGGLTLQGDEEEDGEVDVDDGVEGDERDHGNLLHSDDAEAALEAGDSAASQVSLASGRVRGAWKNLTRRSSGWR